MSGGGGSERRRKREIDRARYKSKGRPDCRRRCVPGKEMGVGVAPPVLWWHSPVFAAVFIRGANWCKFVFSSGKMVD